MLFVGIDPGRDGGIAVVSSIDVVAHRMPATEADVWALLESITENGTRRVHAMLEHVWSIPGQGGAFKFGRSVGHLEMALTAARVPFDRALPRKWQQALGVAYPAGSTDTEKKNITKRRAQALFPRLTITHAIADALLIAEYCRRVKGGYGEKEESRQGVRPGDVTQAGAGQTGQSIQTEGWSAVAAAAGHGKGAKRPSRQPVRSHRAGSGNGGTGEGRRKRIDRRGAA